MEEINIKTLLPVGEKLKPLLSKSCISESDLKGILAERGVFMGDNSKQMSIPLLTLSIRSFFNSTFKTNPYMERAIMTGITRVSKDERR